MKLDVCITVCTVQQYVLKTVALPISKSVIYHHIQTTLLKEYRRILRTPMLKLHHKQTHIKQTAIV